MIIPLHYAPHETYIYLFTAPADFEYKLIYHHAPIPIDHLPFQTARLQCPYYYRQSPRDIHILHTMFHNLVSVDMHDALFETSHFMISAVCIPLSIPILPFFSNVNRHGCYCYHYCNFPLYNILFFAILSRQDTFTYNISGTNHSLTKG